MSNMVINLRRRKQIISKKYEKRGMNINESNGNIFFLSLIKYKKVNHIFNHIHNA